MAPEPWFRDGLAFECTRCGNCCTGGPGMVRVSDEEIATLARRLELTEPEFRERYTRPFRKEITILQEMPNFDCVFYDRTKGCTVYEDRPKQCRTWPFWEINLGSQQAWRDVATDCPGVNHGARRDAVEVEKMRLDDGTCTSALRRKAKA